MSDLSQGAAFIEGEYIPVAEARTPVMDWGFLHSDATYDVAHARRDNTGATGKLNDAYWALHQDPRFSVAIEY